MNAFGICWREVSAVASSPPQDPIQNKFLVENFSFLCRTPPGRKGEENDRITEARGLLPTVP